MISLQICVLYIVSNSPFAWMDEGCQIIEDGRIVVIEPTIVRRIDHTSDLPAGTFYIAEDSYVEYWTTPSLRISFGTFLDFHSHRHYRSHRHKHYKPRYVYRGSHRHHTRRGHTRLKRKYSSHSRHHRRHTSRHNRVVRPSSRTTRARHSTKHRVKRKVRSNTKRTRRAPVKRRTSPPKRRYAKRSR